MQTNAEGRVFLNPLKPLRKGVSTLKHQSPYCLALKMPTLTEEEKETVSAGAGELAL